MISFNRILLGVLVTFALFSAVAFTVSKEVPTDYLGVKGPLSFNGTKFNLAYSSNPKPTYYLQEYLPEGENASEFNQMLSIFLVIDEADAIKFMETKQAELDAKKKTDAVCNYSTTKSPDGKEHLLDFLVSYSKDNKLASVEFNVYRYKQITVKDDKKATLIYCYHSRIYKDKIPSFLSSLKESRINYLNKMISAEMPDVYVE